MRRLIWGLATGTFTASACFLAPVVVMMMLTMLTLLLLVTIGNGGSDPQQPQL